MKYKFKAFIAPFLMMSVYFYMPYILNSKYGWICENPTGCSRISLINFNNILSPELFNLIAVLIFTIIPGIFLILTAISLFLGIKAKILEYKYRKTNNQYYFEKYRSVVTSLKNHTLVFLVFFIIASTPKFLLSLSKKNPSYPEWTSMGCIRGDIIGANLEGNPTYCE